MKTKTPALSVEEAKIIKGRLEGKKRKDIAIEVYPNQTPGAAAVSVSRVLRKATVQDALQASLIKQGITIESALEPIKKALVAKTKRYVTSTTKTKGKDGKVIETTYETEVIENDDIPLQLQGSDRARELLGIGKTGIGLGESSLSPEELSLLASTSDEVMLTQLVFKRSTD